MRWHFAPVPQDAPVSISILDVRYKRFQRTSSSSDCTLGCGVIKGLVKDDDASGGVSQQRCQLLDVLWVLRRGISTACDSSCETFSFANNANCACQMRQAGKSSNCQELHGEFRTRSKAVNVEEE